MYSSCLISEVPGDPRDGSAAPRCCGHARSVTFSGVLPTSLIRISLCVWKHFSDLTITPRLVPGLANPTLWSHVLGIGGQ